MKKLLILLVAFFTLFLVSCDEVETTTAYDYSQDIEDLEAQLQAQIDAIEQQILDLQLTLDNLTVVEGLNGRVSYYQNKILELTEYVTELKTEKDYLDKAKLPEYLFDEYGEFIDENQLMNLLLNKYFGIYNISNKSAIVGEKFRFIFKIDDLNIDQNDYIARLTLMIQELRNYDFYIIGSSVIEIYATLNGDNLGSSYVRFLVQTLLTESLSIEPEIIVQEWLFTETFGYPNLTLAQVQAYYDGYVLNETFAGYVLDFVK